MTTTTTEIERDHAAPIDPRFRARRIAVRRQEGRRRLRRLGRLTALLGLVVVGWLVTRSPLLDVDRIRISGADHSTAEAVLEASGLHRGNPMTDLDPGATARRIEELPWVAAATVHRRW
ncbi:MAG: cell division protein FtsQ/DivIB, partial [Acidimicrobiales bacterium]